MNCKTDIEIVIIRLLKMSGIWVMKGHHGFVVISLGMIAVFTEIQSSWSVL